MLAAARASSAIVEVSMSAADGAAVPVRSARPR